MPNCFVHALPFSDLCDDMFAMLVCATCWISLHFYTLAHMSMREYCLLVCHPCFNTMKLWKFGPNLHFSLGDTTFCLPFACLVSFLFACLPVCLLALLFACLSLLVISPTTCYACFACTLLCFIPIAHYPCISFFPLLGCWFLVFAFAWSEDTWSKGMVYQVQAKGARVQACGFKPSSYNH